MTTARHEPVFSHEYPDGPSGPARSYWDIRRNGRIVLSALALHPRSDMSLLTVQGICAALDAAYRDGKTAKAVEIREALGIE